MAAGDVTVSGSYVGWHGLMDKTVVAGEVILDGSGGTPIDLSTYLSSIDNAVVSLQGAVTPGLDPMIITQSISGATLTVWPWKPTGSGDVTLIASTNNTDVVSFIAIGTTI
jgi:hypothetical protein